jgi:hypothetical protein
MNEISSDCVATYKQKLFTLGKAVRAGRKGEKGERELCR